MVFTTYLFVFYFLPLVLLVYYSLLGLSRGIGAPVGGVSLILNAFLLLVSYIFYGWWNPWFTLPMGISFYTFHALSYSVDVYRGTAPPVRSFVDFACYIALYPQLVAGPIIRYNTVADQLVRRSHTWEKFSSGVALFVLGFAKKTLLANPMARVADAAFNAQSLATPDARFGPLAYAF